MRRRGKKGNREWKCLARFGCSSGYFYCKLIFPLVTDAHIHDSFNNQWYSVALGAMACQFYDFSVHHCTENQLWFLSVLLPLAFFACELGSFIFLIEWSGRSDAASAVDNFLRNLLLELFSRLLLLLLLLVMQMELNSGMTPKCLLTEGYKRKVHKSFREF